MIRTGVIGLSEGNGHPFSFSAIINGYDEASFGQAGWPVILNYLKLQSSERFGVPDVRVTHAWTQDAAITKKLCAACCIDTACTQPSDMLGHVDAVIIARDDWETHAALALPFLERGVAVFVDKPLTLDLQQLNTFTPYLHSGKLMSCSGLRYAAELDAMRLAQPETGAIQLISGAVLNGLDKYGIHLIEAVASLGGPFARPVSVTRLQAPHESFLLTLDGGLPFHLDCLGAVGKTFHLSFFGQSGHRHFDLHDNFSAFHRTLEHFFQMVRTGVPAIQPTETLRLMRLIAAAQKLEPGATVHLQVD
jgi:Oxidoreductase family, NAD-binding Rossmann fold